MILICNRRNFSSILLYFIINLLYIIKYVNRYTESYYIICCLYILFVSITLFLISRKSIITFKYLKYPIIIAFIALLIAQYSIDPMTLRVDRWSAIHNFLKNLFDNIYPYSAMTHLGGYGSPFPIWQLFHIPFYLLGNVGLSFFVVFALFLYSIYKKYSIQVLYGVFIMFLISPALWHEVIVRSDLLTNFILSCTIINFIDYKKIQLKKHYLFIGVICGLFMSTRLSSIIPFLLYFFPDFLELKIKQKCYFLVTFFAVFVLSFLPLLLWDYNTLLFFEFNPFILQTRSGHWLDLCVLIPIGINLAFNSRYNYIKYLQNTSYLLLLLVAISFLHQMIIRNDWTELFSSTYDISYFIMSFPFLILSIVTKNR